MLEPNKNIDATPVELLAILEAVTLFRKSKWGAAFKLLLETDCSLCVQWLERPCLAPTCFKWIIEECLKLCAGLKWSIAAVPRLANSTVDKLAKSGIYRAVPLVWDRVNCDGDVVRFSCFRVDRRLVSILTVLEQ
ncbi:hypothetical protein V6N11_043733 [Hibiscus sabdariffa]|uniref:RNase H type-1 domain-containing protein n=1 Tax=Hibiscus sabdariffa TaxID=183260 RepID=A0ABR2RDJ2_9ROSI